MYFKKLELIGFKSFFDKTTLHFEPGITAVVGPNGCGKSNIFDAIRWVLGEQSAKSLRGSEMLDVIFSGTDNKEPLSMAEVTLTFDNRTRFFNFDNDEMALTRRIFRSGESEYLLNKTPVRLKDILDLLLGTGIGAESYSIVAQGKINLVLSSRPEDRRLVFDEAAGITKYKAQKRETTRKLEETEQNLLRINDIITEVKRQIGSLERQASKARRYKEVFEELSKKEISLGLLQKREILQQKDELIGQLRILESKESEFLVAIREQESKIANRQSELKSQEDRILALKNDILSLESQVVRNNEHISLNEERIGELLNSKIHLEEQTKQLNSRLIQDEEKLNKLRQEFAGLRQGIEEKSKTLIQKEEKINQLNSSIKGSLDKIAKFKKDIMELATRIASKNNEISDFKSKEQTLLARRKRLDVEKAKVYEERLIIEESLNKIKEEMETVKKAVDELNLKLTTLSCDLEKENTVLSNINAEISDSEKQKLTLESQKEFLDRLKSRYEDISERMNAVIYLDKMPQEKVSGLVVKVRDYVNLSDEDKAYFDPASFKLSGEAKPIELDTGKIEERLKKIEENLDSLKTEKQRSEEKREEFKQSLSGLQGQLRNHEISLANKEHSHVTILEQFNKVKDEEDVIILELSDCARELSVLETNITTSEAALSELNKERRFAEDSILREEDSISVNSKLREEALIAITQIKTEIEALNKRVFSDEATLSILEDTYSQDKDTFANLAEQIQDSLDKKLSLESEIQDCSNKINGFSQDIQVKTSLLKEAEDAYQKISAGAHDVFSKIETDRQELDSIKNNLYELQMKNKDIDYKYSSIKERLLQAYKIDLDSMEVIPEGADADILAQDIERLRDKLDSYGTVNLVAIEEYDELKKRYDFLVQQQTDLLNAKESLHQAILKINRTTKQMFLDTFEKVRIEFRNYFRLLFNGGDAQVFLIDEQDPLESGIEIICRPPGKKLQNVLLLSGGEQSLSAIALIFAIFKVKPSPFCVLDEIDAALDEANVDRFSGILQGFTRSSQFIVITHNKRTIANADVMYGITMQEPGISKIVSVKFAKDSIDKDREPEVAAV